MRYNVDRPGTLPVVRFALLLVGMAVSTPAFAQNDVTFGGDARAYAMGGAGIALISDIGGLRLNPASIAFEKSKFDFRVPTIAVRANNDLSLNKVYNYFLNGRLKDRGDINDIARTFEGNDSDFGINANLGLRYSMVEVTGFAVAKGKLQINDSLRNWIYNGRQGKLQTNAPDARADVIAAGYYNLPAIAVGVKLPQVKSSRETYAVGLRLKVMRAYYTHFTANARALDGEEDAFSAPELDGKDYLTKNGVGADLGFLAKMHPMHQGTLSAGMVIANAVSPRFKFDGTDRNGNPTTIDLLKTTANAGVGYQLKGLTLAADLIDITAATGDRDFRSGAELMLPLNLAIRGGYSSASGFTYGVGLFGFNVAFGKRQPLEVVRTINF